MIKILASPSRYIQGPGAIAQLGDHFEKLGKKALILITDSGIKRVSGDIEKGLKAKSLEYAFVEFGRECSRSEIDRVKAAAAEKKADVIVGVGGGKLLDTAKAAAFYAKLPVVIVPTIAATDAPCSALSVVYTPEGVFESYLFLPANPNVVLVDSDIIAKAPARLLVSGMGDALATYFEAKSAAQKEANNCVGGKASMAALALAKLCLETLFKQGLKAKIALEAGARTAAVEEIIEANTLLSGLGFESGGLAGAHAIHNGMTAIHETHAYYHGEKVAFGTLTQLVLEDYPESEIEAVVRFCVSVGLPVTLADLGIHAVNHDTLKEAAKLACAPGDTMGNLAVTVTPEDVYYGMLAADALGKKFKAKA
jgi:glycerol dehydrogenase